MYVPRAATIGGQSDFGPALRASTRRPTSSPSHRVILAALGAGSTVLTFNYDLLIEESFGKTSPWNPKTGYGISLPGVTHDWARQWTMAHAGGPKKSEIILLKLHGSLGWAAYPNGAVKLKARPYYVRRGKYENISVLAPGWQKPVCPQSPPGLSLPHLPRPPPLWPGQNR